MRILVLHSELGALNGGGEIQTKGWMQEMVRRGHEIHVVFAAPIFGSPTNPIPASFQTLPLRGVWRRKIGQLLLTRLGQVAERTGFDKVTWSRLQSGFCNRSISFHNARFRKAALRACRKSLRDFDFAFVHSDVILAKELARNVPTCLFLPGPLHSSQLSLFDRIHLVCSNGDALVQMQEQKAHLETLDVGLDMERFTPEGSDHRARLGLRNEIVLGYAGRLTQIKGVTEMVDGFIAAAEEAPDLYLLIVGEGELEGILRKKLRDSAARERYVFAGNQPNQAMPSYYRTMDALVISSHYENFSNTILEAMACGLPVLASRVGGNPLLVGHDGNGLLFSAQSAEACAKAILDFRGRRDAWPRMARKAHETVNKRYSWAASAQKLERLMKKEIRK